MHGVEEGIHRECRGVAHGGFRVAHGKLYRVVRGVYIEGVLGGI